MSRHQIVHDSYGGGLQPRTQIDRGSIATLFREVKTLVEYVGQAAAHARGKITAARPEHDDQAFRHVLAAMIAHALHHRRGSGIAYGEALTGHAVEKSFSAGSAVQHDVAH